MKSFNYHIDRKYTIWEKDKYVVYANSKEEADKLINQEFEDPSYVEQREVLNSKKEGISFVETNSLYDTMEPISIEENEGCSTIELIDENNKIIKQNGK